MDSAEIWLLENDPDYETTSEAWKHVKTGEYVCPTQEIPWGSPDDLEMLIESKQGRWVPVAERKLCEQCEYLYVPMVPWQKFCTNACREKAKRKRAKALGIPTDL